MRHRSARIAVIVGVGALALPVGQAAARPHHRSSLTVAHRPGPLLNEAAPFNQPPGRTALPVLVLEHSRVPGSLLNEAAPFNQPLDELP